jgi:predicted short-subunit dehydrogenase-like oxidoreductase (DUF2520 family)
MNVVIVGGGKVGTALASAAARTPHRVRLLRARRALPRLRGNEHLVVLAVRDAALPRLAARLARERWVPPGAAVVHVAGGLGPEVLEPLRDGCAGIGQAHPLLAFASRGAPPSLAGAHLWIAGDRVARSRAATFGRALGLVPRAWRLDPVRYHAAAALTANGAVGLLAVAADLLESAGISRTQAVRALAPLLRSSAENVVGLGLPRALTGPIRRGDAPAVARHLAAIRRYAKENIDLYCAAGRAQLPLAETLAEASPAELRALRRLLGNGRKLRR